MVEREKFEVGITKSKEVGKWQLIIDKKLLAQSQSQKIIANGNNVGENSYTKKTRF